MKKPSIKSSTLIWGATFYFGTVLNIAFWRYMIQNLDITNGAMVLFALSLIVFIGGPLLLLFNLIIVPRADKVLLTTLLITCAATNFMMLKYGVYIDKNMIQNVFETNMREASDLLTPSLLFWVGLTGVLPALWVGFSRIEYRPWKQEVKGRLFSSLGVLLLVGLFAATSFKEYSVFGRNNRQVKSLINIVNFSAGTIGYVKKIQLSNRVFQVLDPHAKRIDYHKDEPVYTVLIFVLGETARAANFSLDGYARDTNPLLSKQDIAYFDEVSSCGTATAVSVPCMFSHMVRSNFNDVDARYTENLIDLLQKAGYHIIWKDNDDGCKGVCARVKDVEYTVKTNNPKYCNGAYCYDGVLLEGLEDILKNIHQDTVIVLHTMGSHGPTYYQRYPEEFKKFTPTCDTADIQNCTQQQIINTYDNTILYTDYIVSSAIDTMKKFPQYEGGVIYVSDHGESLGENNIYLHGMPYTIAPNEQTEVPMVVWMNDTMKKWDFVDYACLKEQAKHKIYSHDNLFHSVLGLLEIKTSQYDKSLDLFTPCRVKPLPSAAH